MRIGIDLGGTKTEIICLDRSSGKEIYRHRVPTPKGDYAATIQCLNELVTTAEATLGMTGSVGLGIPGTISAVTGLVKNANSTWLNGQDLDKDLSAVLGRPVKIENDANCFAVSEATDGAAAGDPVVFGVIIGTGCGGGLVVNGKPISGANGIGGEWGHNPLPYARSFHPQTDIEMFETAPNVTDTLTTYNAATPETAEYPGPLCYCGRRGCLETWISGTGFKNDYKRVAGDNLSTHDIIKAANAADPKASAALERYADRLARALATIINTIDPTTIVLGGGMSNISSLYDTIPQIWKKYVFSDTVATKLAPPRHGDSSGVRGAAWLWSE